MVRLSIMRRWAWALAAAAVCGLGAPALAEPLAACPKAAFGFNPPGQLVPGSGKGLADKGDWSPGMRFPIRTAPDYPNSQVFGIGGAFYAGPAHGGWSDPRNFQYPWGDTFCEARPGAKRPNKACPGDDGHQGQDIRAATPADRTYEVVAPEDGKVVSIQDFAVIFLGDSVRRYVLLHMHPEDVKARMPADHRYRRGQTIGLVSNYFGYSYDKKTGKYVANLTTRHLHFEIMLPVKEGSTPSAASRTGWHWVSPYVALVCSYQNLLDSQP